MRTLLLCVLALGLGHARTILAVEVSAVQVAQTEVPTAGATPDATPAEATAVATLAPTEAAAPQATEAPTAELTATPVAELTEEMVAAEPAPEASPEVTQTPTADLEVMEFGSEVTPTTSPEVQAGSEQPVTATASVEPTVALTEEAFEPLEEEGELGEEEIVEEEAGASVLSGYDGVERLGAALSAGEWRVDGRVAAIRDGEMLGKRMRQVVLTFGEGQKPRKGDRFVVFRPAEFGIEAKDGLRAAQAVGVLKLIGVFENGMLASVERQFGAVRVGDIVRNRQVDKKAYQLALSKATKKSVKGLSGRVLSSTDSRILAKKHGSVYIDLGTADGAAIGMRLDITRKVEHGGPKGAQSFKPAGQFGQLEIVNVFEQGAVAVIVRSKGYVKAGDLVQSR